MSNNLNNLKKSWKTTLVGLVILLLWIGDSMEVLELDPNLMISVIGVLTGFGFVFSKDGDKSHSKKVVGPRPDDRGRSSTDPATENDDGNNNPIDLGNSENGIVGPRPGDRG